REEGVVALARVRLTRDTVQALEAQLRRNATIQLVDLRAVPVEELDEARLRAGRAAHAPEAQGREPVLDLLDVEHEVLQPQAGTLADRGRLRRLEVRVAERRQVAVLARKVGERRNRCDQPLPHEQQRLPVLQQL